MLMDLVDTIQQHNNTVHFSSNMRCCKLEKYLLLAESRLMAESRAKQTLYFVKPTVKVMALCDVGKS